LQEQVRPAREAQRGRGLDAKNQKQDARSKMLVEETVLGQCICGSCVEPSSNRDQPWDPGGLPNRVRQAVRLCLTYRGGLAGLPYLKIQGRVSSSDESRIERGVRREQSRVTKDSSRLEACCCGLAAATSTPNIPEIAIPQSSQRLPFPNYPIDYPPQ